MHNHAGIIQATDTRGSLHCIHLCSTESVYCGRRGRNCFDCSQRSSILEYRHWNVNVSPTEQRITLPYVLNFIRDGRIFNFCFAGALCVLRALLQLFVSIYRESTIQKRSVAFAQSIVSLSVLLRWSNSRKIQTRATRILLKCAAYAA